MKIDVFLHKKRSFMWFTMKIFLRASCPGMGSGKRDACSILSAIYGEIVDYRADIPEAGRVRKDLRVRWYIKF